LRSQINAADAETLLRWSERIDRPKRGRSPALNRARRGPQSERTRVGSPSFENLPRGRPPNVHLTNHTGTRITLGRQARLYLGNLDAKRDWGHASDDVRMQWLMLQQDHPEDCVIATGQQHAVRDLVQQAAREIGIEIRW
jgi:nucleoside-diphosphate-sugar epimerase